MGWPLSVFLTVLFALLVALFLHLHGRFPAFPMFLWLLSLVSRTYDRLISSLCSLPCALMSTFPFPTLNLCSFTGKHQEVLTANPPEPVHPPLQGQNP